ncbi:MAG: acyl-CoA desaturase [Salinivirgaceae bacterium]|nr:MAG: acyl-CoA desaturase [Salinivirgaceae bacterium]
MERIKYKQNNVEFTKELWSAVNNYFESNAISKFGGSQILIKTFLMSLVYFVPYVLMMTGMITTVVPLLTVFFVMGIGMSGIGVVTMHDANHGSFSKHEWVNKLFGMSLYILGGLPANWKYQHNTLHHGYTNVEDHDEDIGHGGILRFSPHKPLKKVHKYQYIYAWALYGLMTFSWITLKDFKRLFKYKRDGAVLDGSGNYTLLFIKLLFSKIIYYAIFLALPIIIVPIAWYWIVLGFLLMHFVSGLTLSTIFQTAHVVPSSDYPLPDENNELESSWTVHQLYTTADFAPNSKVFSWLVGGLNYQVVHHLFPSISHVHYKSLSKIVQETTQKYNLPYHVNGSFFRAIGQHLKMLKALGTSTIMTT